MIYPDDFINKIIHGDCLDVMDYIHTNTINLIVTSPPYWNQKTYAFYPKYSDYMENVIKWVKECYRILEPGRHCFWIIPDKLPYPPSENGTKERMYMPIYADTEWCARKAGFIPEFPIIWKKKHGTQKMFGSYPFPPTIIHTPMTERICVWRKSGKYQKKSKEEKELSRIDKQDWADFGVDWWEINAETKSNHPAPFPKELVRRILLLWSFENDVVFDPFIGSGTVAVVAKEMKRQFIGSEYLNEYCEIAKERIDAI